MEEKTTLNFLCEYSIVIGVRYTVFDIIDKIISIVYTVSSTLTSMVKNFKSLHVVMGGTV